MKYCFFMLLIVLPFLLKESPPPGAILPVQHEGRIKPLDTVARTSRIIISGKEGIAPTKWLLQRLFEPQYTLEEKDILNTHPDLFSEKHVSLHDLLPHLNAMHAQIQHSTVNDAYQEALKQLWNRMEHSLSLTHTLKREGSVPIAPAFGITPPNDFDETVLWETTAEDPNGWSNFKKVWPDLEEEAEKYLNGLKEQNATLYRKLHLELAFNTLSPFFVSRIYYVTAAILSVLLAFFNKDSWIAASFLLAAFVFHTLGIICRMLIEGRPPVTNMYSSALFVGWTAVLMGVIFLRKTKISLPVASVIGFVTLSISHHLSLSGDTLEMMRAVLDSNFWLTTHVLTITLGYSTTFLAGFLSAYALLMSTELKKTAKIVYRIVSFALALTFIGTLLGGIWADQSWGRFWGWDPKENGALMIVLWNTTVLHLRVGGFIKDIGILRAAVFGNIVTSFSWFGVNMLGVGLHSYGFIEQAFFWLIVFVAANLLIICKPIKRMSVD